MTEMSRLGAWLPTTKPLTLGELFELRLALPGDAARLTLRAEVMWVRDRRGGRGAGMGVEFVGMSDEIARRLERALGDRPLAKVAPNPRFRFTDA